MERKGSLILVGLFVLTSLVSLIGYVFWMGKYGINENKYLTYKTDLYEAVSGLKRSSVVRIQGIDVGFVEEINLDSENPRKVEVVFKLDKKAPITSDSYVVLSTQGVVGVSFLDIRVDGDGKTKDKMIVKRENYLPSKPSDMELLTKNAKNIISDLQVIVKKSDLVLSEKNIKNIEKSIENFAQTSIYLNSKKHNIDRLFEDSNIAIRDFSHSMQSANRLVEESQGAILETKELIKDGRLFISNQSVAMQKIENDTGDIIGEVKALTKDSREFVEELKKAPINFIFGGAQQKIGPGE